MKKYPAWRFITGLGFVLIALVLYLAFTSYLSPDSQIAFIFAGGLILGFSILQDANTMRLRDELETIKMRLERLEERK